MSDRLIEQLASITGFHETTENIAAPQEIPISVSPGLLAHVLTFLQGHFVSKLHRQQLELNASLEQVQVATERLNQLRSQLRLAESNSLEATSKLSVLESRCASLETALGKEKAQRKLASQELQGTLESFAAFRRQQAEQTSKLRAQLETAQLDAQTARAEAERMEAQVRSLTRQVTLLQDSQASLKTELKLRESRFLGEMEAKDRLVQAYAQAAQNASQRAQVLEAEMDGIKGAVVDAEADFDERQEEWRAQLQESNQRCKQLQADIDRLQASMNALISATEQANNNNNNNADESNTNNSSLSSKLTDAKVASLEVQLERLKDALDEAVSALNANQPRMQILTEDNARLQCEIASLTEAVIAGAAASEEITALKKQLDGAVQEGRALMQENADLARQVQGLLAELEGRKLRLNSSSASGTVVDSATLITERLVDFASIEELQQRNQELLRALRSTCAKMEALEAAAASSDLVPRAQLEEARRELQGARESRMKQAALVDRYLKGRINEDDEPGQQPQQQKEVVKVVEVVREAPIAVAAAATTTASTALVPDTSLQVKCAQLEAQLEVARERGRFAQEALEALKADHSAMLTRFSSQQGTLQYLQAQGEKASAELAALQDREAHLQAQVVALQAEAADLQASLTRLQAENETAVGERDRLSALIPSLQGMLTDHEASEAALKRHFDTQLAFMERELQTTRKLLSDSTATHAQTLAAVEKERSDLLGRLEQVMHESHSFRQSSMQLEVEATNLRAQVQELERVLKSAAERELSQDQETNKTNELKLRALAGQIKELKEALSGRESRIAELESELAVKQDEIQGAKSALEEMKAILSQSGAECDALKTQLAAKEAELQSLRAVAEQVSRLESEVARLTEANAVSEQQHQSAVQELQQRLDELAALKTSLENTQAALLQAETHLTQQTAALGVTTKDAEQLRTEVNALRQENSTLMDELMASNASSSANESDDVLAPATGNDSRLLKLLRADKDKLIEERDKLSSDCTRLQAQLDQLQATLNAERAAVSTQAADYTRLLEQIEELQAKSAEGIKARLQVEQLKKQLVVAHESTTELANCTEALERAQAELKVLNEIVGERDTEIARLQAEIAALRQASGNLKKALMESKLTSAKEIEALKRELEAVKQQLEDAKEPEPKMSNDMDVDTRFNIADNNMEVEPSAHEVPAPAVTASVINEEMVQEKKAIEEIVIESAAEEEQDEEMSGGERSEIEMSSEIEEVEGEIEGEEVSAVDVDADADNVGENVDENVDEVYDDELQGGDDVDSPAVNAVDSHESKLGTTEEQLTLPLLPPPAQQHQQPQPIRKIVSLAGITSSSAAVQSTPAAPVQMITTASGKKIIPITAPDPVVRKPAAGATLSAGHQGDGNRPTSPVPSSSTATATAVASADSQSQSPGAGKKTQKKQLNMKKKKKLRSAGVGKNARR